MCKPKHHPYVPQNHSSLPLDCKTDEYGYIEAMVASKGFAIEQIARLSIPSVWRGYQQQKRQLKKKLATKFQEPIMFHVTTQSAASKIAQEGFCVKLVKNLAFGRGVNLYRKIDSVHEHLGRYDDRREIVLLVCQVLVGLAHENSSNLDEIVYRNGAGFSKPRYYRPRKGFDSMHSDDEEKSIWVIPSKNRVYPSYLVTYLWPER